MAIAPTLPDPAIVAWDAGGNNGLDQIFARAFGISGGYEECNGILNGIKVDLFQELGLYSYPMLIVVARLRDDITAKGKQRPALEALYVGLGGNGELRSWVETYAPELLALVSAEDFESQRPDYEADRLARRVKGISRDLSALAQHLNLGEADKQLAREIIGRLDELSGFKSVHDTLHQLQMSVMEEFLRVSADSIVASDRQLSIQIQLEELKLATDRIRRQFGVAGSSPAAVQARDSVLQQIKDIAGLVQQMDATLSGTAETAARVLRTMLRQQMGLFDSQLVNASEQIPFSKFGQSFDKLARPPVLAVAKGENPILLENVSSSFQDVARRLVTRQSVHRLWQQTDATILNVEELLGGTGREIEIKFHWSNIEKLIRGIAQRSTEADIESLLAIPELDLAASAVPDDIRSDRFKRAFSAFSRFARVRFQRADNALLEDCGVLRQLNDPLQALL